jgi:hypothetical protein
MTQQELFDSTVQAFLLDKKPFGSDPETKRCRYLASNGARCAIGLHLDEETARELDRRGGSIYAPHADAAFATAFGDLDRMFAREVQKAHDIGADDGTQAMIRHLAKLAHRYELDTTLLDAAMAANKEEI